MAYLKESIITVSHKILKGSNQSSDCTSAKEWYFLHDQDTSVSVEELAVFASDGKLGPLQLLQPLSYCSFPLHVQLAAGLRLFAQLLFREGDVGIYQAPSNAAKQKTTIREEGRNGK